MGQIVAEKAKQEGETEAETVSRGKAGQEAEKLSHGFRESSLSELWFRSV